MFYKKYGVSDVLPYESLDADPDVRRELLSGNGRISISGVQPKYSMVAEGGLLRLSRTGEQGQFILKPAPVSYHILYREWCPVNEHLSMSIASGIFHIETAENALCFFGNGRPAYVTRRFDLRPGGGKYAMEDLASVAGLNKDNAGDNYKYDVLSYEDCAGLITANVKAAKVELLKFFRLVIYNYIISNDDAHIKNFSLIDRETGDYVLSPAYDLMNTSLHLDFPGIFALSKGLMNEEPIPDLTFRGIDRKYFSDFGKCIGLPQKIIDKEIGRFAAENPDITDYVNSSLLPDHLKSSYLSSLTYRQTTLR